MSTEIERKFLVQVGKLPQSLLNTPGESLLQGYLSSNPSVRVRVSHDVATGERNSWITIKGPGLLSRQEFEYGIPNEDAIQMLGLCKNSLSKTRRKLQVGSHTWEVDEFTGPHKGLWLAEIELDSEDEEFIKPEWLGEEVSYNRAYVNSVLAEMGKAP